MPKNQIFIFIAIAVVVLVGIISWALTQKPEIPAEEAVEEEIEEIFSMSAVVQSVDAENNYLQVLPANQEKEVRVILSRTSKLIRSEFPFDPANPPAEASFTPIRTEIGIADFKVGDRIFIKTKTNIAGKAEFGDVDFIHILP